MQLIVHNGTQVLFDLFLFYFTLAAPIVVHTNRSRQRPAGVKVVFTFDTDLEASSLVVCLPVPAVTKSRRPVNFDEVW